MLTETENKILSEIVNAIKNYEETDVDIPFTIAPIYEAFEKKMCEDLVRDVSEHEHSIFYSEDDEYYDTTRSVLIHFEDLPFHYKINCFCEDRYWGFCECTPDMPDYRKDKGCCGHGCDWCAPAIEVKKVYDLMTHSWSGDEHSYWDFENTYYQKDKEIADKKKEAEKAVRRAYLESEISKMTTELETLY